MNANNINTYSRWLRVGEHFISVNFILEDSVDVVAEVSIVDKAASIVKFVLLDQLLDLILCESKV